MRLPPAIRRFTVLRDCGALRVLFPEIDALFGARAGKVASGN